MYVPSTKRFRNYFLNVFYESENRLGLAYQPTEKVSLLILS